MNANTWKEVVKSLQRQSNLKTSKKSSFNSTENTKRPRYKDQLVHTV